MRVLVCGGREDGYKVFIFYILDYINSKRGITEVIHGGARGVDYQAGLWARERGILDTVVKPDWNKYGRSAAFKRNIAMLDMEPDLVVAFAGGNGTYHTYSNAKDRGLPTIHVMLDFPDLIEGRLL